MNNGFTPSSTPSILAIVIDPQSTSTVYAGTGGFGVFKSIDAGANWALSSTGIASVSSTSSSWIRAAQRPLRGDLELSRLQKHERRSELDALEHRTDPPTIEALAISQTGTCLHAGTNETPGCRKRLRLCLRGGLRAAAPACAASGRRRSAFEPFGASGKRGDGLRDPDQYRFISRCRRQHRTACRARGKLRFPDHRPATNQVIGTQNVPVDIPPASSRPT